MAQNYFSIVTNIGRNKLALSAAGGAAVTISHFAIGDGNGAEVNPTAASQTLVREVWRVPVESVAIDPQNPSALLITAIIPTAVGGWWMREFGIFDVAGDMIAVAKPVSQYKPTALEGQLEDIRYEFQIIIGETANVTMLVDPSVLLASREWVQTRKIPVAQLVLTPWVPVKSMTVTAPPANAVIGDTYLIPATATGAWAGQSQKLAEWNGSSWTIITTKDGHGVGLPDGRVFERVSGIYVEFLASRDWVNSRQTPVTQLNALPWLPVKSMTLTAPPAATEGDLYLIPAGSTGTWAGKAGQIAEWSGGAWMFKVPADGHGISLPDGRVFERVGGVYVEKLALDAQSGKWTYISASGTANALTASLTPVPSSIAAGMTIRLKIANTNTGPATLNVNGLGAVAIINNAGSPLAYGDLPANSLMQLFYTGDVWMLAGLSASHVKVKLTGVTVFYVRPGGNDGNSGLANTNADAFQTIIGAWNTIRTRYDTSGYDIIIQLGIARTYAAPGVVNGSIAKIRIVGDRAVQGSYIISGSGPATGQSGLISAEGCQVSLEGVTIINTSLMNSGVGSSGSGSSISLTNVTVKTSVPGSLANVFTVAGGNVVIGAGCIFGGSATTLMYAQSGAISISSSFHVDSGTYSVVARSSVCGSIQVSATGISITGSCIGTRYYANLNSVISTSGAGPNFFPGSVAGLTDTGGQYA